MSGAHVSVLDVVEGSQVQGRQGHAIPADGALQSNGSARQDAQREPFFSFRNAPANIKRTDALGVGLGIIDGPRDGSFQRPRERDIVGCSEGFKRRIWTTPPISKISPWSPLAAHGTAPASGGRDLLRAPQAALPRPKAARCTAQRRSAPCVEAQFGSENPWHPHGSRRQQRRTSRPVKSSPPQSTSSGLEPRCFLARLTLQLFTLKVYSSSCSIWPHATTFHFIKSILEQLLDLKGSNSKLFDYGVSIT